jgi:ParB/RepB/Spo0J family partition protein
MKIPIDSIVPNPEQPRRTIDPAALEELAQSIKSLGVIQPITVEISADGQTHILHDGERRWRAARLAGLTEIPAEIVAPLGDDVARRDRLTRALVANVQRTDLNPIDIARAYQNLHDLGLIDQQIADQVGKSRSTVANARRLLDLPADIQDLANVNGVSERQIAALLPLYQNPKILKRMEKEPWGITPSKLIDGIRSGQITSSNEIRNRVIMMIHGNTEDLSYAVFPLDHPFDGLKVKSSRCDECPARVKSGDEWRCPDETCFKRKGDHWRADQLRQASEISGIPVGDLTTNRHASVGYFYNERDLLDQIVAAGCPNLRLEWANYGGVGQVVPDFPHVQAVCYHGEGKHCTCLSKARAERTRSDPLHIAEREREKALQSLLDKYGQVVADALRAGNLHVWLRILRIVDYQIKKGSDMTLDQIQQRIGCNLVNNNLTYRAKNDLRIAQQEIDDLLAALGIQTPETGDPADQAAQLKRRFQRIQGWIADLDPAQITVEALDGNLANLDKLTVEFDALAAQNIDNPDLDGFLLSIAEAWEILTNLKHELQTNGRVGVQTPDTQDAVHNTEADHA